MEELKPDDKNIVFEDHDAPKEEETYAEQPHKPRRRWRKVLKYSVVVLILAVIIYAGYLFFSLSRLSINPFTVSQLKGETQGRINILVLGTGDEDHAGPNLSDTNLVISINTKTNQVAMLSVPRDLRVDIPGYGEAKINEANSDGGPALAEKVVENTLGIPIDYYVKANFTGLQDVVNAVGGIDINVQTTLSDPEFPCSYNQYLSCGLVIKPGEQHMDGAVALDYVRCRKGTCGNDFGRDLRQQQVLQAVKNKVLASSTLLNPVTLAQLTTTIGSNVQTDLSINQLLQLGGLMKKANGSPIINAVLNITPEGFLVSAPNSSDLLPATGNFAAIQRFVQGIFKYGPIWVENPNVAIENGTTVTGLAGMLKDKIKSDGYSINIVSLSNAPRTDYQANEIIDYSGGQDPHTIAYLESLLGVKAITPDVPMKNLPYDIMVILGNTYAQSVSSSGSSTTN